MKKHKAKTNEVTEIKLPSAIEHVLWMDRLAAPGGTVGVEVFTRYVGSGAPAQLVLTDKSGKTLGTFKDAVYANRITASIKVPKGAKDALFLEAKLPDHGLSMKSGALLLTGPVEVREAKWDQETVTRDDVLTLSARVEGVPDGAEALASIWRRDEDGAHELITQFPVIVDRQQVEAEWAHDFYGDTRDLRTEAEGGYEQPAYFFRVSLGGVEAESGDVVFEDVIELTLTDGAGDPLADADVTLHLADGAERTERTGTDGTLTLEKIPPGPFSVELPDGRELQVG